MSEFIYYRNLPKLIQKEVFAIVFKTTIEADIWRMYFINKFISDVVWVNRHEGKVELTDQIWYFVRNDPWKLKPFKGTILPQESVYIILDDPERKRLDTYEGDT